MFQLFVWDIMYWLNHSLKFWEAATSFLACEPLALCSGHAISKLVPSLIWVLIKTQALVIRLKDLRGSILFGEISIAEITYMWCKRIVLGSANVRTIGRGKLCFLFCSNRTFTELWYWSARWKWFISHWNGNQKSFSAHQSLDYCSLVFVKGL